MIANIKRLREKIGGLMDVTNGGVVGEVYKDENTVELEENTLEIEENTVELEENTLEIEENTGVKSGKNKVSKGSGAKNNVKYNSEEEESVEEKIKKLIGRIDKLDKLDSEEITKTSLIMPFFTALGYDTTDPDEFIPEVIADIGNKKGEKIDYCINVDGKPVLAIECKKFRSDLSRHVGQLHRYFPHVGAKVGVLTNGNDYWFFSDTERKNIMDLNPYLKVRLSELEKYSLLEDYARGNISKLDVRKEAVRLIEENKLDKLKRCINGLGDMEPSDKLMKILMCEFKIKESFMSNVESIIVEELSKGNKKGKRERNVGGKKSKIEEGEIQFDYVVKTITDLNDIDYETLRPTKISFTDSGVDCDIQFWKDILVYSTDFALNRLKENYIGDNFDMYAIEMVNDVTKGVWLTNKPKDIRGGRGVRKIPNYDLYLDTHLASRQCTHRALKILEALGFEHMDTIKVELEKNNQVNKSE